MIQQDLVEIWRRIALDLEPHLWYIIDDTEEFSPSLREAIGLTQEQYGSLLLSSGIRVRTRRGLFGISTDALNYLQTELRGQCAMNNTRIKLPDVEKRRYFISIGTAHSKTPNQQATTYKALLRPRIKHRNAADLSVIDRLCRELDTAEEPELIVDNGENQDNDTSREEQQEQNEEQEHRQHLDENQPLLRKEQQQRRQQFEQQQLDHEQQRQKQFHQQQLQELKDFEQRLRQDLQQERQQFEQQEQQWLQN